MSPEPTPVGIEPAAGSVAVVTVAAGLAGAGAGALLHHIGPNRKESHV